MKSIYKFECDDNFLIWGKKPEVSNQNSTGVFIKKNLPNNFFAATNEAQIPKTYSQKRNSKALSPMNFSHFNETDYCRFLPVCVCVMYRKCSTHFVKSCLTKNCVKFSCPDALSLSELRLVGLLFEFCFALAFSTAVPSFIAAAAAAAGGKWDGGHFDTGIFCFKSTAGDVDRKFKDTLFDDLQRQ